MVRAQHTSPPGTISRRWDDWLGALIGALETTATGEGFGDRLGRCPPLSCLEARNAVLAQLSRPAGGAGDLSRPLMTYSPAICNLGRLPCSMPRSRASSRMM